ncbi:MAG: nitrate- and nitrite sensing domain-containing protein [Rhodocyclaceae bacterium]
MDAGLWGATGVAVAILLGGVAKRRRSHGLAARKTMAADTLASTAVLLQMVASVQQHRGMSAAWLSGDTCFAARLPGRQAEVERLLAVLGATVATEAGKSFPFITPGAFAGWQVAWRRLLDGLAETTPDQSFQAHCALIAILLEWLAALVEARIEAPLPAQVEISSACRNLARRLPALAESLGQARALASAVAASGRCRPVPRVRLQYLVARAERLLADAGAVASPDAGGPAQAAAGAVVAFLNMLRIRLLHEDGRSQGAGRGLDGDVDIAADEVFALGTAAVDGVFAWLEAERRALAGALAPQRQGTAALRGYAPAAVLASGS